MKPRLKPLHEQVLVITGGSSGNGLAIAQQAVRRGAAVVLAARNAAALEQVASELRQTGGRVAVVAADVSRPDDVERIAEGAIAAFGGFDTWINNAAVGVYGTLDEIPLADHRQVFAINYFGTLHGCLVAARHLKVHGGKGSGSKGRGGAIINVGSILGDRSIILQGPYSATKHAVQGLTDALRVELEREGAGIAVILIKPGGVATPYPEHARNYMDQPPRIPPPVYDPSVVADAVLFACENRRRVLYVGSGGILASLAGQVAPRLTDRVMEAVRTRMQQSRDLPGKSDRRDNLYGPRADGAVRTSQDIGMRRTSFAVAAQKIPVRVWLSGLGMAVIGGLALRSSRGGKS